MVKPHVQITSARFSDDTTLHLTGGEVVVFVGPNNAGKSVALKNIHSLLQSSEVETLVIKSVKLDVVGSENDLIDWMEETSTRLTPRPPQIEYRRLGNDIEIGNAKSWWKQAKEKNYLRSLAGFFCCHLLTELRLEASKPAAGIKITQQPKANPIHFLFADPEIEDRVSVSFRAAFGEDLIVHRSAGNEIPLYVGSAPTFEAGTRGAPTRAYLDKLEALPRLETEGDGMRSFVGILLHATVVDHSIVLIDEPEAFLHPPQARLIGRMLVQNKNEDSQLFVATHSADVLRGLLHAGGAKVRVVRLRRKGDVNEICQLSTEEVRTLWADPLLRYSNILDGLFHEKVIVCEGDSDCRFYEAVATSIAESQGLSPPDALFVHCGGKQRMATVVKALRAVGVPVVSVADFDILRDEQPLRGLLEALGGEWYEFEKDWQITKTSIDRKKPELEASLVVQEIRAVLDKVSDAHFPEQAKKEIQATLRRSTTWSLAKDMGKAYVPAGEADQACRRLLQDCRACGSFVVEIGELERFDKSVGGRSATWVNAVLKKDLATDTELRLAREFVEAFNSRMPAPHQPDPVLESDDAASVGDEIAVGQGT